MKENFDEILAKFGALIHFKKLLILPGLENDDILRAIMTHHENLTSVEVHDVSYTSARILFKHTNLQELSILNYDTSRTVDIKVVLEDFKDFDKWFPRLENVRKSSRIRSRKEADCEEILVKPDHSILRKLSFTNVFNEGFDQNKFLFACTQSFPFLEVARSNGDPVHLWKLPDDEDLGSKVFRLKELTVTKETWQDLIAKAENYKHLTSISVWEVKTVQILRIMDEFVITKLSFLNHKYSSPESQDIVYGHMNEGINFNAFTEYLQVYHPNRPIHESPFLERLTSVTIDGDVLKTPELTFFPRVCINLQELIIDQRYCEDTDEIFILDGRQSNFESKSLRVLKIRSYTRDGRSFKRMFDKLMECAPYLEELEIKAKESTLSLIFAESESRYLIFKQHRLKIISFSTDEEETSQDNFKRICRIAKYLRNVMEVRVMVNKQSLNHLRFRVFRLDEMGFFVLLYKDPNIRNGLKCRKQFSPLYRPEGE